MTPLTLHLLVESAALENTLLNNEKMAIELYQYELEDMLDDLKESLLEDNDDSIFSVTVHKMIKRSNSTPRWC
jgi:mannosyltransferase OCH1-like enzyme